MFGKNKHMRRKFHPLKILFFVGVAAAFALTVGWVVMFLWNAILPDAVGVKPLTYWQAVGLLVLCKILFGGFGNRGKRWEGKKERWRNKWNNKWQNMSEEDREKMKSRWEARCNKRNKS